MGTHRVPFVRRACEQITDGDRAETGVNLAVHAPGEGNGDSRRARTIVEPNGRSKVASARDHTNHSWVAGIFATSTSSDPTATTTEPGSISVLHEKSSARSAPANLMSPELPSRWMATLPSLRRILKSPSLPTPPSYKQRELRVKFESVGAVTIVHKDPMVGTDEDAVVTGIRRGA